MEVSQEVRKTGKRTRMTVKEQAISRIIAKYTKICWNVKEFDRTIWGGYGSEKFTYLLIEARQSWKNKVFNYRDAFNNSNPVYWIEAVWTSPDYSAVRVTIYDKAGYNPKLTMYIDETGLYDYYTYDK